MAGLEADTSSYAKLPANPPGVFDTIKNLQGVQQGAINNQIGQQNIQSNAIQIDKSQYDLVASKWAGISKQMPGLIKDPSLDEGKIVQLYKNNVQQGLMTPEMAGQAISQIPPTAGMGKDQATATLQQHLAQKLQQGQTTMEALEYHLPKPTTMDTGNQQVPITVSRQPGQGIRQIQPGIPTQLGPGQPSVSQGGEGQPPRGTPGVQGPVQPGTPTGLPTAGGGSILPFKPGTAPPQIQGTGGVPTAGAPRAVKTQSFVPTGLPPGAETAMKASGEQLSNDRLAGASFQRDIFPLAQAIPALEKLGAKGTGPGTETINNLKSFAISNIPGVKEGDFDGTVKDYDKAKKYLTDFVNQTGNSGTNDKLAAAFAGNPSTHISNAAAVDVAKSALALRRMKQAQLLTFEQSGLPESEYSKWNAGFTNALDPRAFGVDLMDKDKLQKMYKQIDKNPVEAKRFDKSLDIAHKLGFITPPSQE